MTVCPGDISRNFIKNLNDLECYQSIVLATKNYKPNDISLNDNAPR